VNGIRTATAAVAILAAIHGPLSGQRPSASVPSDPHVLRLHLLGHEIGDERYTLVRSADGLVLADTFTFVDRGGRVTLVSSFEVTQDFTPRRFRASGRTYRFLNVDVDIAVEGGTARIARLGDTTRVDLPAPFYTVDGYAPLAARSLLIRYWEQHGRPSAIAALPGGSVTIEHRGTDTIRAGTAEPVVLARYMVNGVAWGREVVWLDTDGHLAAIFTRANILPLEGIRDDLAGSKSRFAELAAADCMRAFGTLSRSVDPVASGTYALVGARVIDMTGRPPLGDAVVLVRDGRIAAVGDRRAVTIPDGTRIIDATGKTIVPGLWDMHAHAGQIEWAPTYLAAGVTTIRDMGGETTFLTAFRDAVDAGRGAGPRMLLAGLVDGDVDAAFGTTVAATPGEGRAIVDRYHALGFRQMKLYTWLEPEVVRAVIERAHELGMTVTGHIPRALSLEQALDAGMDNVAHMPLSGPVGSDRNQAAIRALVEHHTVVDPTLSWNELLGHAPTVPPSSFQPGLARAPWPIRAAYESVRNDIDEETARARQLDQLAAIRALHDAGVPIVAGTDYGVPGHSLHRELELYVLAGLSPMDALRAATAVPAQVMGLAAESGTIEVGRRADLLVLDADPLADMANIRRGRWVVVNGTMYDCAALWRLAGFRDAG
jgi:imidazolonepropionase-like amidohydrolase